MKILYLLLWLCACKVVAQVATGPTATDSIQVNPTVISDAHRAYGIPMTVAVTRPDGSVDAGFSGSVSLRGMQLSSSANVLTSADFEGALSGWGSAGGSTLALDSTTHGSFNGNQCGKLSGSNGGQPSGYTRALGGATPVRLSYYMRITNASLRGPLFYFEHESCLLLCSQSPAMIAGYTGGLIKFNGATTGFGPVSPNTWYKVDIVMNWSTKLCTLWVNDQKIQQAQCISESNAKKMYVYNLDNTVTYIDQLQVIRAEGSSSVLANSIRPSSVTLTQGIWTGTVAPLIETNAMYVQAYLTDATSSQWSSGQTGNFKVIPACREGTAAATYASLCTNCTAGSYNDDPSATACSPCPEGTYNPLSGQGSCTMCEGNTFNNQTGQTSSSACVTCPTGSYASNDHSECGLCPDGQYSPSEGVCANCTAGTYGDGKDCLPCPPGTINLDEGQSECTPCPAGYYSFNTTVCVACDAGSFAADEGSEECSPCLPGSFNNDTAQTQCSSCPVGSYNPNNGSVDISDCLQCPNGTFGGESGLSICTPCAQGYFQNVTGRTNCSECQPGTYANTQGSDTCDLCNIGTYNNITASSTCFDCGTNYSTTVRGSTFCTLRCGNSRLDSGEACDDGNIEGGDGCTADCLQIEEGYTCLREGEACTFNIVDDSTSSESEAPVVLIAAVAGSVGGCLILSVAISFLLLRRRWNRNKQQKLAMLGELELELVVDDIIIKEKLGGGNFGEVYRGIWHGTTEVALKQLKDPDHVVEFAREATMLKALHHPNIVQYIGIFSSKADDKYIVCEYLQNGALDKLLIKERDTLSIAELVAMSKHVVAGLQFLEQNNIVHRDVACRNMLVANKDKHGNYVVKVSDFGLSRSAESGYYKSNAKEIPIKWCAPEVFAQGVYSSKSDVWSFGITLWEIFSYGELPYQGMTNAECVDRVKRGYRLPQPASCPDEIYKLMIACWQKESKDRPTFLTLFNQLNGLFANEDIPSGGPNVPRDGSVYNMASDMKTGPHHHNNKYDNENSATSYSAFGSQRSKPKATERNYSAFGTTSFRTEQASIMMDPLPPTQTSRPGTVRGRPPVPSHSHSSTTTYANATNPGGEDSYSMWSAQERKIQEDSSSSNFYNTGTATPPPDQDFYNTDGLRAGSVDNSEGFYSNYPEPPPNNNNNNNANPEFEENQYSNVPPPSPPLDYGGLPPPPTDSYSMY